MSTRTAGTGSLGDVSGALNQLLQAQMRLTSDFLESVTGMRVDQVVGSLQERVRGKSRGCCDVPPPCWIPRQLGECVSHVSECRTACIDLVITNCDRVGHPVEVQATGPFQQIVKVEPASIQLGPFERQSVRACVTVPQGTDRKRLEILLWVRGCHEHLLRWVVSVGTSGLDACHEVRVDDCPDFRHHWYDHFYCARGCTHTRSTVTPGPNG